MVTSRIPADRPPFTRPHNFTPLYRASCFCGTIEYDIAADALDSMYCHCETCQTLHGAPYQWAAVVRKTDVAFVEGCAEKLVAYHSPTKSNDYILPCKLGCPDCHAPLMDEGRNMMLILPPYLQFSRDQNGRKVIPTPWKPTHHMFYGRRCADMRDGLKKYIGRKGEGECDDEGNPLPSDDGAHAKDGA